MKTITLLPKNYRTSKGKSFAWLVDLALQPWHPHTSVVHSGTRTHVCACCAHSLTLHSVSSLLLVSAIVCCRLVSIWFFLEVSASAAYRGAHTACHTNIHITQGAHIPHAQMTNSLMTEPAREPFLLTRSLLSFLPTDWNQCKESNSWYWSSSLRMYATPVGEEGGKAREEVGWGTATLSGLVLPPTPPPHPPTLSSHPLQIHHQ